MFLLNSCKMKFNLNLKDRIKIQTPNNYLINCKLLALKDRSNCFYRFLMCFFYIRKKKYSKRMWPDIRKIDRFIIIAHVK